MKKIISSLAILLISTTFSFADVATKNVILQDEGTTVSGAGRILNFTGAGVAVTFAGGKYVITIGGGGSISDTAYGISWSTVTDVAPSKKALYDKIETLGAGSGDVTSVGDCTTGACLDGTSDGGTYISFYDAQGAGKLITGDIGAAVTWTLPTTGGTLIHTGTNSTTFGDGSAAGITWTYDLSGTDASMTWSNGNVGIGTTSPTQKLELGKGHLAFNRADAPSTAVTAAVNATAGNLNGAYRYRITYVTADGETESNTVSASVAPVNQQVDLTNIPISGSSLVTARRIYRTPAAGGWPYYCKLLTTINDNTTTTYTDNIVDGSLGAYLAEANTSGSIIYINSGIVGRFDTTSMAIGVGALAVSTAFSNMAIGAYSLYKNTLGYGNLGFGTQSLYNNLTGSSNTAIGTGALYNNSSGAGNTAIGGNALYYSVGSSNVAIGNSSMYNTTGYSNVAIGGNSLYGNKGGYQNLGIGYNAGRYITGGATANETSNTSIYIGDSTKSLASGDTNEIVIGYDATGIGSNTVVLGNDSIVTTALKGSVGIGTTSPTAILHLKAGVAGASSAPLKFTSGTLQTSPELGAVEFDGDNLYITVN